MRLLTADPSVVIWLKHFATPVGATPSCYPPPTMSIYLSDEYMESFEQRSKMVMDNVMHIYEEEERASFLRFIAGVRAGNNWEDELSLLRYWQGVRGRDVVEYAIDLVTQAPMDGTVIDRQLDPASLNHLRVYWEKQCRAVKRKIRGEYKDEFEDARNLAEAAEAVVECERKAASKDLKKANRRRGFEAVPVTPPVVPVVVAAAPVVAAPAAPDNAAVELEVDLANKAARRLKLVTPKILKKLTVPEPPVIDAPEEVASVESRQMERRRLRDTARLHAKQHRENEQRQNAMNEYNTMRKAIGTSYTVVRLQSDSDPVATIERELNTALLADAKKDKVKAKVSANAKARAEAAEVRASIFL